MASTQAPKEEPSDLTQRFANLGRHTLQDCYPEFNPVDIYRAHLATTLSDICGINEAVLFPAIKWTQTLDKGDLILPVPALRVKGEKPAELAMKWASSVRA